MEQEENVPPSPKWIKPSDVLILRKKVNPVGVTQHRLYSSCVLKTVDPNVVVRKTGAVFNPFRKSAQKRQIDLTENYAIGENNAANEQKKKNSIISELLDDNATFEFANSAKANEKVQLCSLLPVDWSIKTKVRFISNKSFPWKGCLKASEESSGTTSFVRCLHSTKYQECTVDTSVNARFHQQCLVWTHPFLPWLDLFPRFGVTRNSSSLFSNNPELQNSLHSSWCDSFRSLYQLVRARQCPYFYLCAATFTAVFRSSGIAGFSDHHVLLTPTTRGFRQSLKEEGISFTMPLHLNQDTPFNEASNGADSFSVVLDEDPVAQNLDTAEYTEDVECGKVPDEEEPGIWLESLGLSQNDFPALNPKKRKPDQGNMDHKPKSLICIQGSETQALVNFLLNSRSCIASTGGLAGVPPTLLAPCAFHGATLQPLKVRQARMSRDQNCIEIVGPILPNALDNLCNLFKVTQDGQFTAMMKTQETTEAFSLLLTENDTCTPSVFATENLKDSGLCPAFLQQVCKVPSTVLRPFNEITAASGSFSWK